MKKIAITTISFILFLNIFVSAQDVKKKKQDFRYTAKTMTELGMSAEQQQKIVEIKAKYDAEAEKLKTVSKERGVSVASRQDSMLTAEQKHRITIMRDSVKTIKKTFTLDKQAIEALGFSPEQKRKLSVIKKEEIGFKKDLGQQSNKIKQELFSGIDGVLTVEQKKKVTEIKAAIELHNKSIQ